MRIKICLATALACLICTGLFAQANLWGVRASLHGNTSTLASDKFDAANGFNNKGGNLAFGLSYAKIKTGQVGWTGIVTGITYRQMNIVSKTNTTNFQFKWLEIPAELSMTGNFFGFLPVGLQLGAFGAVPFQYKGSVYRYQQPEYVYGNEKYEKPYFILGFKGGATASFGIKGNFITTFFANYSFGFIPIGPAPAEGVTRAYDTPLPAFVDFGICFLFGKEAVEKP
jgi:hypothetical protein